MNNSMSSTSVHLEEQQKIIYSIKKSHHEDHSINKYNQTDLNVNVKCIYF